MTSTPNLDQLHEWQAADERRRERGPTQPVTIFGRACSADDVAVHYNRYGGIRKAESFRLLIPDLPPGGVVVDLEHRGQSIGALVYAEADGAGQLDAVVVVDDADCLRDYAGPVYFSPTMLTVGDGVSRSSVAIADAAALIALALTDSPATLAPHPVTVLPGDVRAAGDRDRWVLSWRSTHPLLARAVEQFGPTPQHRTASRILERRTLVTLDGGLVIDERSGELLGRVDRARVPVSRDDERPAGPLEIRPCRIVAVR